MSKSIKFRNNVYLSSASIVNGRTKLTAYCSYVDLCTQHNKQIWIRRG